MKLAFLFSGQGAQYTGMMRDIAQNAQEARRIFDIADTALGRSISGLCFDGPQDALNVTRNTQPCVLAADLAAWAALEARGYCPDAVAGFSLGEYAALVASDALETSEAFKLIQMRAEYMQTAVPIGQGAMAAVMKLSADQVQTLCDETEGYVVPANYNCPGQIVVSGEAKAVERLMETAKSRRIRTVKLPVSAPFHCELMRPAGERLSEYLQNVKLCKPSVPVFMNVDGCAETDPASILTKMILQASSPVLWERTIVQMHEWGIDTFVELGPGKTLSGFVKKTLADCGGIRIMNVTDAESLDNVVEALGRT